MRCEGCAQTGSQTRANSGIRSQSSFTDQDMAADRVSRELAPLTTSNHCRRLLTVRPVAAKTLAPASACDKLQKIRLATRPWRPDVVLAYFARDAVPRSPPVCSRSRPEHGGTDHLELEHRQRPGQLVLGGLLLAPAVWAWRRKARAP